MAEVDLAFLARQNERIMADLRRRAPACFKPENAPKYALTPLAYSLVGDRAYVHRKRGGA